MKEQQSLIQCPEIAFGIYLARNIREAVLPLLGFKQTGLSINPVSKDFSYELDKRAEEVVKRSFERAWRKGLAYGYVTEDQGLVMPPGGNAEWMCLVDPVDGSRPLSIGAEMACANIGITRGDIQDPTLKDIEAGVVLAIKERKMFVAKKGHDVFEVVSDPGRGDLLVSLSGMVETPRL